MSVKSHTKNNVKNKHEKYRLERKLLALKWNRFDTMFKRRNPWLVFIISRVIYFITLDLLITINHKWPKQTSH